MTALVIITKEQNTDSSVQVNQLIETISTMPNVASKSAMQSGRVHSKWA